MLFRSAAALIALALAAFMLVPTSPAGHMPSLLNGLEMPSLIDTGSSLR